MKKNNIFKNICKRGLPLALAFILVAGLFSAFDFTVAKADTGCSEEIEALLSQGEYAENCVIAVVRVDLEEKPSFRTYSSDSPSSLIDSAESLMTVSKDTVEEALDEELPDSDEVAEDSENLVSVSSVDEEEAVEIVKIESDTLSTSELLYALADDERVIYAEPNYYYTLDNDTLDSSEEADEAKEDASNVAVEETADVQENASADAAEETADVQENESAAVTEDTAAEDEIQIQTEENDSSSQTEEVQFETENTVNPSPIQENVYGEVQKVSETYESYDLTSLQWGYQSSYNETYKRTTAGETTYANMGIENWNDETNINATGVVAVMDTGVDYTNPDLVNVMVTDAKDRTGEGGTMGINTADSEKAEDPMDDIEGHGTHCAGIIGAEWNDYGTSGAANGVKILAVKIEKEGYLLNEAIIKGFAYLEKYAKSATCKEDSLIAVNCSWGSAMSSNTMQSILCTSLGKAGTITIFSSGNSDYDNDIHGCTSTLLAKNPYVISVNAADFDGTRASYSSYGLMTTNVYGAGTEILSTFTNIGNICAVSDTDPIYRNYFSKEDFSSNLVVAEVKTDEEGKIIIPTQLSDLSPAEDVAIDTDSSLDSSTYSLKFPKGAHNYWIGIPVSKDDLSKIAYISGYAYSELHNTSAGWRVRPLLNTGCPEKEMGGTFYASEDWINNSVCLSDYYTDGGSQGYITLDDDTVLALFCVDTYANDETPIYIDCLSLNTEESVNGAAGKYILWDGTSMAAPSVSGCAAVAAKKMASAEYGTPESAIELADYLKAHVSQNENFSGTCSQGGIVNLSVDEANTVPVVKNVEETGANVTVSGNYFGKEKGQISINGADIDSENITSWSNTEIVFEYTGTAQGEITLGVTTKLDENTSTGGKTGYTKAIFTPGEQKLFTNTLATPTATASVQTGCFDSTAYLTSTPLVGLGDYIYAMFPQGPSFLYCSLFRYSIKDDEWSIVLETEGPTGFYNCSMTAYDGKLYIYGKDDYTYLFSFDPETNTLEEIDISVIDGTDENPAAFVDATIFNANNQLMLIGGTDGDGNLLLEDNVAEIYINDNVLSYKIVGSISIEGTEDKNPVGVISPKVTVYNGEIYVGCYSSRYISANGTYYYNIPARLFKLTYSDGKYITTDISESLPEFIAAEAYKTSSGYLRTYGLTNSYKGIVISGANIKSEDGTRSIVDTYFLDEEIDPFDYSAHFDTLFHPASITYGGKLYTIGMTKHSTDEDRLVFRSVDIGSYQVDFINNGFGSQPYTQQIKEGDTVAIPEGMTAEGYIFEGWYTDRALTNKYDFNTAVTSDFTLYAKWSEADPEIVINTPDDKNISVDKDAAQKIFDNFSKKYGDDNPSLKIDIKNGCTDENLALIKKAAPERSERICYEVSLSFKNGAAEYTDVGSENTELLSITYAFDYSNKKDIQVLRVHNGKVDELTEAKNAAGEYVKLDKTNNKLTICASKYSTYSVVYNKTSVPVPSTGDSSNSTTWIIICIAALVVIIVILVIVIIRRKKPRR